MNWKKFGRGMVATIGLAVVAGTFVGVFLAVVKLLLKLVS